MDAGVSHWPYVWSNLTLPQLAASAQSLVWTWQFQQLSCEQCSTDRSHARALSASARQREGRACGWSPRGRSRGTGARARAAQAAPLAPARPACATPGRAGTRCQPPRAGPGRPVGRRPCRCWQSPRQDAGAGAPAGVVRMRRDQRAACQHVAIGKRLANSGMPASVLRRQQAPAGNCWMQGLCMHALVDMHPHQRLN